MARTAKQIAAAKKNLEKARKAKSDKAIKKEAKMEPWQLVARARRGPISSAVARRQDTIRKTAKKRRAK